MVSYLKNLGAVEMDTKNQALNNIVVDDKIFIIRGIQVMIDKDLAELYQVQTSRLN
ncbi:MAG: ORF6N domain-containing protein [Sulfurimonas sp.]|nr:ORF6N domain-containing protein [Sulfurimonas sp.]